MANINVVFPKTGSPVVIQDPTVVFSEDHITWQIYTHAKDIKSVKVEFDTGRFFLGAKPLGGPKGCMKNFTFSNGTGYAVIVAQAPAVKKNGKRKKNKYTIYGYAKKNAEGKPSRKLDPTIITDPPAPPVTNG